MVEPHKRYPRQGSRRRVERTSTPVQELISPARRAAYHVLFAVSLGDEHADDLLHATGSDASLAGLSEVDRNLTMALVMGVLRWQTALDQRLHSLFTRAGNVVPEEVMIGLRLGAFQLLHLDRIPAHAALSESVALVRAAGHEYATGMVNAVLRKIANGPRSQAARIFEATSAAGERLGHPAWMTERWERTYGRRVALAICEADQQEPRMAGLLSREDSFPLIDEGSRLVAEITAAAMPLSGVTRVWDCCAAPGGKTAIVATRLQASGFTGEVLATDVSERRMRAMEERLGSLATSAGLGGPVRCLVSDAAALPATEGFFDLALCDVPCSGTGTLGRNPEIRLRLRESDLGRQAARQQKILRATMSRVSAGGRLVYSTCSLEPEECEAVIASVLQSVGSGWVRLKMGGVLGTLKEHGILLDDLAGAVDKDALRTIPGIHAMDGFYAVVLERQPARPPQLLLNAAE